MRELPSGTVTFLFTDVEGSTKLLHELGADGYADALAEHRRVIREACARNDGVEVDTQGDAFFFSFPTAIGALESASKMTEELAPGPIQVRIGLHTGAPLLTDEGYVGDDVHFGARVAASGHGGQVLLSAGTASAIEPSNSLLQGISLVDLGEHRLKDIESAVSIFQLGDGSFPPLKTISNTNLPRPASSFVGREQELAAVLTRIRTGARLLTLTGPGGSGKTRLALEAASSLVPEYKAGVFWIGLAPLRDPALVMETIAQVLGSKDGLAGHVGEREILLLLDNLEQVIEAAPELASLIETCPNLTLLVTSRELLRVRGEAEYPVPPLPEPEAVSLFCERSQLESSEEIAELCARLDNLPLAVELAAARTTALSPTQILERLSQRLDLLKGGRDADPRQQTLRATIEWSYELLSPEEQRLFARLSVFAGGCTLEAAEEVADADLDTLQSLVEKSLLRFTDERYWLLETIRGYAVERLDETERTNAAQRHTELFAGLVARLGGDQLWRTAGTAVLEQLDAESANLRETLRRLSTNADGGGLLEVAGALAPYWLMRGQLREGRAWMELALTLSGSEDTSLRGQALSNAADFARALGDLHRARAYASESLELAERLGDSRAIGQALHELAESAAQEHDFEDAKLLYERAILHARKTDYPAPGSISNLADIALAEGDYDRARELSLQAANLFREAGNDHGYATSLFNLACAALGSGQLEQSRSFLRECLDLCVELRFAAGAAWCLEGCAAFLVQSDKPREAAHLLGASQVLVEEIHTTLEPAEQRMHDETEGLIRAALSDDDVAVAWNFGRRLSFEEALSYAISSID